MPSLPPEQLLRSTAHHTLLRYLLSAQGGVDERFLTDAERAVASELEALNLIERVDSSLRLRGDFTTLRIELEKMLLTRHASNEDELARLRDEHRQISRWLQFIQELTSTIIRTTTMADLFASAFRKLSETIEFDVAVALMLEQNIDVYISKRSNLRIVDDQLIDQIRQTLQSQIAVSFVSTDVLIQSDFSNLPASEVTGDPLSHQIHTTLRQEDRNPGILLLFRATPPFGPEEQRMLEILSAQVSMVLGNIRAQEQIQNLADSDDLTGIWNKRYFRRQLPSEVERSRIYSIPLSLLLFDVDNFKEINDTFGHPMGDVVLSELCGTVRETLRPPDLFARFGGDEFAIILPHTDRGGARAVAERILQRVRNLSIYSGDNDVAIRCSISAGISSYAGPEDTAADLLRRADENLYSAKRGGRNRYVC